VYIGKTSSNKLALHLKEIIMMPPTEPTPDQPTEPLPALPAKADESQDEEFFDDEEPADTSTEEPE
jgi:hypothetical protein